MILKLQDGRRAMRQLFLVLQVLICLDPKTGSVPYTRAIMLQLLVLLYQSKANTVAWQMLVNNFSAFNEETGELAFSVLARCVLGDSTKSKFEHLNNMYTLLHTYIAISEDVRNDVSDAGPNQAWRKKIAADAMEVQSVRFWFEGFLRNLRHNSWTVYSGEKGYPSSVAASNHQATRGTVQPMFTQERVDLGLALVLSKCRKMIVGNIWGYQVRHIWPEFNHPAPPLPAGAVSQLESSDDGDETDDEDYKPEDLHLEQHKSNKRKGAPHSEPDSDDSDEKEEETAGSSSSSSSSSLDFDARGEPVPWSAAGAVTEANITPLARSTRRQNAARDWSGSGMVANWNHSSRQPRK